ncbi:zinc-dependent alcohol dehydrogenase family protein [Solimicrobium silvestre]|uniref:NADPH:quinone reductase and related Zn-dependent oxidoreductase n=1 Tax=Solimicrobium silvestre TaxID=2099400 RepID=A0A2S9GYK7_9BURK|nr:NAD(P)-dependent alcohol dehydrogenase [Solimicrobium silvestre]PRC92804.1 NADPH:quinone reductase and related Zn-dependent oxidoreductase [Solimicrobium silvestre]
MQAYQIKAGQQIAGLEVVQRTLSAPTGHEVQVRIHAVSLNYRDLMIVNGSYRVTSENPVIPCSDGAGEVIAVGAQVTRFKVGDRVAASFFPEWINGNPTTQNTAGALGAAVNGMLAEEVILSEDALVAIPKHLTYVEAATIPCAGVTAWNSLFVEGGLRAGDSVLLLGTGGVSIWALQLAKAAGLRTIITSSSDEKLERARSLGASATINYKTTPEWQDEVLRLTDGKGVDLVLEVGGQGTLPRSITSARMGGKVAIIGGVSGFGGEVNPAALIGSVKRLAGIFVGSRSMFEDLNKFLSVVEIHPVVDRIFPFLQAREAFTHLEKAAHFGKVVIEVRQ